MRARRIVAVDQEIRVVLHEAVVRRRALGQCSEGVHFAAHACERQALLDHLLCERLQSQLRAPEAQAQRPTAVDSNVSGAALRSRHAYVTTLGK